MYWVTATESPSLSSHEFILSVCELDSASYPRRIVVSSEDSIGSLISFFASKEGGFEDEMDLILRRDIPYPLCPSMKLGTLLVEHRMLFVVRRPGPPSSALPLRYLRTEMDEKGAECNGFDFSFIRECDTPSVDRWLSLLPSVQWIRVDTTLPWTLEVLLSIGEQIRTFSSLRHIEWRGDHPCQEGFAYIRYHLAMDQYRKQEPCEELFHHLS